MRLYFRITIALLLIFFGYKAVRQEFGGYDVGLLSEFNYLFFALTIILTIVILILDYSYFKKDKRFYQFSFSVIGLTVCLVVIYKIKQRNSIDSSKTIIKVVNKAGADNVWQFDFKDSKYFILKDYNLLGHKIYYGKYQKHGDTLKITESNYSGKEIEIPKTGIIKADTVFWNKFDTMLISKE